VDFASSSKLVAIAPYPIPCDIIEDMKPSLALKWAAHATKFVIWVFAHPQLVIRYWRRFILIAVDQSPFSFRVDLLGLILLRKRENNQRVQRPILFRRTQDSVDILSRVAEELCETVTFSSKSELTRHSMLAKLVGCREVQSHHVDWLGQGITLDTVLPRDVIAEAVLDNLGLKSAPSVAYFFNENKDLQSRLEISDKKRQQESWLQSNYEDFTELVTSDLLYGWKQFRAGAWTSHELPVEWSSFVTDLARQRMTMGLQIALARRVALVVCDIAGGFWLAASLGKPHLVVNICKYFTLLGPRGVIIPVLYRDIETGRVIPYSEALGSPIHNLTYREERKIMAVKATPSLITATFSELKFEIEAGEPSDLTERQLEVLKIGRQRENKLRGGVVPRVSDAFLQRYPDWIG